MSDTGNISQSIIEAGARAEYERDMTAEESDDFEPFTWDEALTRVKDLYRERFKAGLAAAFAECEVTEQMLWSSGGTGSRKRWVDGPYGFGRVYARRLVVVTPAQEET